ncbi:helix-turn-helix domain-containing protein [Okibacterium endophyticum]
MTEEIITLPRWDAPEETFHLLLHSAGTVELQRDEPIRLPPEHCLVIQPQQATRVRFDNEGAVIALSFPRSIVDVRSARLRASIGRPLNASEGVAAAFASLLRSLADASMTTSHAQVALHLSDAVTALLSATLIEAAAERGGAPMARADAVLLATRRWIEEHLGEPGLTIKMVASANHISISYLQKLFAADGHAVSGWIRERRCERCRRDLSDPSQRDTPIASIAERWGFMSAAHFSRVFVKNYGLTPREYRSAAMRRVRSHGDGTATTDGL